MGGNDLGSTLYHHISLSVEVDDGSHVLVLGGEGQLPYYIALSTKCHIVLALALEPKE